MNWVAGVKLGARLWRVKIFCRATWGAYSRLSRWWYGKKSWAWCFCWHRSAITLYVTAEACANGTFSLAVKFKLWQWLALWTNQSAANTCAWGNSGDFSHRHILSGNFDLSNHVEFHKKMLNLKLKRNKFINYMVKTYCLPKLTVQVLHEKDILYQCIITTAVCSVPCLWPYLLYQCIIATAVYSCTLCMATCTVSVYNHHSCLLLYPVCGHMYCISV